MGSEGGDVVQLYCFGGWGVRGKGRAHLHTVGDQEVPDGRIVDALCPLNAVVNVVDFDRYAECLINGQGIEMQRGSC